MEEQNKINKKIKIFLQVNIGDENQKSGISKNEINNLVSYCKEIQLDVIGLMCIPPANIDPEAYFEEMKKLNGALDFSELRIGMTSDFLVAVKHLAHLLELDQVFLVKDLNKFLFKIFLINLNITKKSFSS